jgi:hypothetical protein
MIGRNLSIGDSFTLLINNESYSPFTINLFNLGGGSAVRTSITTQGISASDYQTCDPLPFLQNGIALANYTIQIRQGGTAVSTTALLAGTNLNDLMTAVGTVTNLQGVQGNFFIRQKAHDPTAGFGYDFVVTTPSITSIRFFSPAPPILIVQVPMSNKGNQSFVTGNPFVLIGGTADINFIQQSEIGNSYRIMGIDVISNQSAQLLEDISYGDKQVDGNRWLASFTPTIDPYQNNSVSLHSVGGNAQIGAAMDNFTINPDSTFSYTTLAATVIPIFPPLNNNGILVPTYARLTFNFVRASEATIKEFNQAVASELLMKFAERKNYLESLKYRKGVFLQ